MAAWPLAARAQQPERVRRVGVLIYLAADDAEAQARLAVFTEANWAGAITYGSHQREDRKRSLAAFGARAILPRVARSRVLGQSAWSFHHRAALTSVGARMWNVTDGHNALSGVIDDQALDRTFLVGVL